MLKKILSMLLLGILFIKPIYANTTESSLNPDEMMTYYYKNKDINKALDIIQQLSDSKILEQAKHSFTPVGQKTRQDLVVMSAIWSLESNAKQHDIVAPFAKFPPQSDNMGDRNIITFYKKATQKRSK